MAERFRVSNLTEALNLAREFNTSGKYNLFRGQGRDWSVKATMARLTADESKKGVEKLERLLYYMHTHKPLEKFVSDIDWFYAVAQHYGLPTNYIDFSSSVDIATFFATNSKSNKIGEDCVIICLQEIEFNHFIEATKFLYERDKVEAPCIIRPKVDNLWRLQAQHGCFFYSPYVDFDTFYDFDKIIFPFSEPYREVAIENVYPERKSELEILLDHYFNTEKRLEGSKRFMEFINENNVPSTELAPPDSNQFLKNNAVHFSWETNLFNDWLFKLNEEWRNIEVREPLIIHFDYKKSIEYQILEMQQKLSEMFTDKKINRDSIISFEIISKRKISKKLLKRISDSCSRIWDGTRNLPFEDIEIQSIIAKYVCLEIYGAKFGSTPTFTGEKLVVLELVNEYGSVTRCYASPSKINASFRDDLNEVLIDQLAEDINERILLRINKPNLVFDFIRFLDLFKDELIAYQVYYNSEDKNPVIFYTPTQIAVMGYA